MNKRFASIVVVFVLFAASLILRVDRVAIAESETLPASHLPFVSAPVLATPQPAVATPQAADASTPSGVASATVRRYCVTCHNSKLTSGGMRLDNVDLTQVAAHAPVLEKVLQKVRAREMPPRGIPRPDDATYQTVAAFLETELDRVASSTPQPGRPTARRLNRLEYGNVIRDLLALEIDAEELLPAETQAYGFDNIGDVVSMTPSIFERYVSAARKVSALAIGNEGVTAVTKTYTPSKLLVQDFDRLSEDLPFGSRGGIAVRHHFPVDGEYSLRVAYTRPRTQDEVLDVRVDGARVAMYELSREEAPPMQNTSSRAGSAKELRFEAKAGTHTIAVTYIKGSLAFGGLGPMHSLNNADSAAPLSAGRVQGVTIGGPYKVLGVGDTPSRRAVLVCRPAAPTEEEACASKILARLARRAFRQPVAQPDIEPLVTLYTAARQEGTTFEGGIQQALTALLVDPRFLFRIEHDAPSGERAYRLSDIELASRLSFFLWSTMPDEQLLALAEAGKLSNPTQLEQQVRRMLADERANALVESFTVQWLHLRNLQHHAPDSTRYPGYDHNLRDGFRRETELFVESQIRDDRPIPELLTAPYTFVNERLAQHYGIADVYGNHFRRVPVTDESRFGLLGHASIQTLTSYPTRTSVVVRGNWLLTQFLDAPLPPPPADVPALNEEETRGANGKTVTLREKMEEHRKNPSCSVCHSRMDPLGFAMENFDAIGRWRTLDGDSPLDVTGELVDGTKLEGPTGLRQVLLKRREDFVGTVASRLLVYATGRGLEYYDKPVVRTIIRESADTDYRWSSIILNIVKSATFQMRSKDS